MTHRLLISLSDEQMTILDALMGEDAANNRSAYLAALIAGERKRREAEREKRSAGRPRNSEKGGIDEDVEKVDYTDDIPKNIPYFGKMIGKREYADIQSLAHAFKNGL